MSREDGIWFGPRDAGSTFTDVLFGILLPLLCFTLDPGVVWGEFVTPFSGYPLAVCLIAGAVMIAMVVWLTVGRRDAYLAGILFVGALLSITLAVFLFPFALVGSIMALFFGYQDPTYLLGFLGFVPFFTAFVCFRAGTRILGAVTPARQLLQAGGAAAVLLALALAYQNGADRMLDNAVTTISRSPDPREVHSTIRTLERLRPVVPRREFTRRGLETIRTGCGPEVDDYTLGYEAVTGTSLERAARGGMLD